ncbi:MAG TPA: hypothetical protein VM223_08410 [Planctomycetota bacterium]|nr:hypothetical protein [Planctomycetota bacterium]
MDKREPTEAMQALVIERENELCDASNRICTCGGCLRYIRMLDRFIRRVEQLVAADAQPDAVAAEV